jgi:hypothetical protein
MATSIGNTGITFPDSTTQTTAATTSLPGILGQVFTSSGTFTIPTGVTALKVTVVGGGAGGSGNGGGGGGAGVSIAYLTGLTSSATLSVTVGGGGGGGSNNNNGGGGGLSRVSSGTQSITSIIGNGGGGGAGGGGGGGGGGSASGGSLNFTGQSGTSADANSYSQGGASFLFCPTAVWAGGGGVNAFAYGGGGTSTGSYGPTGGSGYQGIILIEW